jgi:hypothetical protein
MGWIAIAVGGVSLLGAVFLGLLFALGQPFGTLNDISIAVAASLSGLLAWVTYSTFHSQSPQLSLVALLAALTGAVIVVIGSALVISGATGWYLAGLWMMTGNALIGVWLLGMSASARGAAGWPNGIAMLGLVAGAIMILGLLTIPGILRGIDAWDAAPWVVNLGQVSGLGWILLYHAWCIWLGRFMLAR